MSKKLSKKKEKIFITGGVGFIGSYTTKLFLEAGDKVLVYDLLKSYVPLTFNTQYPLYLKKRYEMIGRKFPIVEGDIRDYSRLLEAVKKFQPNIVIHLAALPIADTADLHPQEAITVNYNGTLNLLGIIKNIPSVKKFIFISSSMIYGDFQYTPADEKHPQNPKNVYGGTKLGAEIMTKVYAERFGFDFVIIRPSSVYGPTDCNRRVTQLFLENAIKGKPLVLHNGGESKLDFSYVEDVAKGIYLAAKKDEANNQVFNITRGEGRSLKELALIIKKYFPKTKIIYKSLPEKKKRPKRGAMDISKAKKLLAYSPECSLERGIEKYIKFLKKINLDEKN